MKRARPFSARRKGGTSRSISNGIWFANDNRCAQGTITDPDARACVEPGRAVELQRLGDRARTRVADFVIGEPE
eukprot:5190164-Prymnesium_polylepis.1